MEKVENHTLSNHNHHHPSSINQINHHLLTSINHIIHPFFRKAPLEPLKPAGEAPPPNHLHGPCRSSRRCQWVYPQQCHPNRRTSHHLLVSHVAWDPRRDVFSEGAEKNMEIYGRVDDMQRKSQGELGWYMVIRWSVTVNQRHSNTTWWSEIRLIKIDNVHLSTPSYASYAFYAFYASYAITSSIRAAPSFNQAANTIHRHRQWMPAPWE